MSSHNLEPKGGMYMKLYEVLQTKNPSYILGRPMTPIGILVHSTGATNQNLNRYVDAPAVLGRNIYTNHWNQTKATKSMHAFVGLDINKQIAVAHTLPYNMACWGAGAGNKGSYNRDPVGHIQFEICEDNAPRSGQPPTATQTKYYHDVWKTVEDYCVYLCQKFGFPASAIAAPTKRITSHYEAALAGYASNHGDPRHWMRLYGDSMDKFRARVAARLIEDSAPVPDAPTQNYTIKVKLTTEDNLRRAGNVPAGTIREYDFEEYVATSTAGEVGNAPTEAAKAQAIVVRTFAWPNVLSGSAVLDTSPSQSFRLERYRNSAFASTYAAAKDTAGMTVGYNGKTVPKIYYADSNGGVILATSEKWGKQYMPWHLHKNDPWDFAVTNGKINGHQIGMSQKGATYAAQQGKTAKEILAFYYPNTAIVQATKQLATFVVPPVILPTLYLAKINTRNALGLYMWKDPQKSSYAHKDPIPKGKTINVLSKPESKFVWARYNGKEGYVDTQYLLKLADIPPVTPPPAANTKKVKTNLGKGIGIWKDIRKSSRILQIPDGTVVTILKIVNARWAYVQYKAYKGYCDRNYLKPNT